MKAKDIYEHFDYLGRVQTVEFYQECKYCRVAIIDKPSALASHLKKKHPEKHIAWSKYRQNSR